MQKLLITFPGQGSQALGMGADLAASYASARETFEAVDDALGFGLYKVMTGDDQAALTDTSNAQPAIMAVSLATARVLEQQSGKPLSHFGILAAGHSLGEYSALAAFQALTLADTARLLQIRGQAMAQAGGDNSGMMAILGLDHAAVTDICSQASAHGICVLANDNAPGQIVISGEKPALEVAATLAKEQGAKRALPLPVSAAFHSPLMQSAADIMAKALAGTAFKSATRPIIHNVDAAVHNTPDETPDLLTNQVCAAVRWRDSLATAAAQGVTGQLELGHGAVLSGLAKRCQPDWATYNISKPADLDAFLTKVEQANVAA